MKSIKQFLHNNTDFAYAQFSRKFITTQHPILGVRIPLLRKFAKEIKPEQIDLETCPSHEEILLYGLSAVANYKSEEDQLEYLQNILPLIDNWCTCDVIVGEMKSLTADSSFQFFLKLLSDDREFYVRVGIVGLMRNFLKTEKLPQVLKSLKKISANQYYVKMAVAWLYAELASINFESAKKEISSCTDPFIFRKAVLKANESRRLTPQQKATLKNLKPLNVCQRSKQRQCQP